MMTVRVSIFIGLFLCFCHFFTTQVTATDIYVDYYRGDDSNSGLSWTNAKQFIPAALTLSATLPGPDTVHVTEGYNWEIELVPETILLGGYPEGGGMRDPSIYVSYIIGTGPVYPGPLNYIVLGADNATIDGFTITRLRYEGDIHTPEVYGGAIFCYYTSPTITNNIIEENFVSGWSNEGGDDAHSAMGGGICCFQSTAIISGNIIRNNGSIGGSTDDEWCDVSAGNGYGGGISCYDSDCEITGNIIENNKALSGQCYEWSSYFTCTKANARGGGIYVKGGNTNIMGNIIMGNETGAVYSGETAASEGAGIYADSAMTYIANNVIGGNSANDSYWFARGGGIFTSGTIINNTIFQNDADFGGGATVTDNARIFNNIFLENESYAIYERSTGSAITIKNNNFYNNIDGVYLNLSTSYLTSAELDAALIDSVNNISCPPMFSGTSNYLLSASSCCIDAGLASLYSPSTDIDGDPRPYGSGYDIGADEFTGPIISVMGYGATLLLLCSMTMIFVFGITHLK